MERWEQLEELSLLWAWGDELCLAIIGPSQVMSHLSAGKQAATLHHTEIARELATLQVAVSSVVELVLGCSPNETSWVEVTNELVANFQRWEELCSGLEGPGVRICDLLLGLPLSQAWWANCLAEAIGWLKAELTTQRLLDPELGPCGLRLCVFHTWCCATSTCHLHW
jgi:hypothetical protein